MYPSELLFYGADGKFAGVVQSSSGVRQGSPLSTLYFCALMQPILETLAEEFPGIKIFAFIDDINLASANSTLLAKAFDRLRALLTANSLEVAPTKCVWFGGKNKIQLSDLLHDQGIRCEFEIIKILGAYIGDPDCISQKLCDILQKHQSAFRRLKKMGINNVSTLLLSKCVNIRHRYHIRVHDPQQTLDMASNFDAEVNKTLKAWLGNLTDRQISWLRLPTRKGGLGITPHRTTT